MNPSTLFRLIQWADSALPVGGFTFSGGVETAAGEGLIPDAVALEEYVETICRRSATLDGVAALWAHRAAIQADFARMRQADDWLWCHKSGVEAQQMSLRMGHKLSELGRTLLPESPLTQEWDRALRSEEVVGCHATTLGVLFAACHLEEQALFSTLIYGVASQLLGAALRTLRISHIKTQQLLFRLATPLDALYASVASLRLDEMHTFAPEAEILASLHERGARRMFMN